MGRQGIKDKKKLNREKVQLEKKQQEQLAMPMNQYLNRGSPVAMIIKKHFIDHFDPVYEDMRIIRAGIMDLRHYELNIKKYKKQYEEGPILEKNEHGMLMSKEELYQEISDLENVHIAVKLLALRKRITNDLLAKIDDVFQDNKFESFVLDCIEAVQKLGYELFPKEIEVVKIK